MTEQYTPDELDYARERVAIMVHDGGMMYEDARKEVEKMIIPRRGEISSPGIPDRTAHGAGTSAPTKTHD